MTSLEYGIAACETMMRKFKAQDLPPKAHFHYHQGVFLSGMEKIYQICKDERYFNYIRDWVDSLIDEEGNVKEHVGSKDRLRLGSGENYLDYGFAQLDDIQPGILFYPLYNKTGDPKYEKAMHKLVPFVLNFPRNRVGGLWHKLRYPSQMWLDGLYMGGPICAEYGKRFGKQEYIELAIDQALLMREHTEDKETGLWYHAWDASGRVEWADPKTGLSPEFWGRSIGWVPVAVLQELAFIDRDNPRRKDLENLVRDLLVALVPYQGKDGRWYQVTDKLEDPRNWPENSCTCLFVAAMSMAIRMGILDEKYLSVAKKGYDGLMASITFEGEDIQIGNVCVGTGVGNLEHYYARGTSVNDLHGVGSFLIMCAECAIRGW